MVSNCPSCSGNKGNSHGVSNVQKGRQTQVVKVTSQSPLTLVVARYIGPTARIITVVPGLSYGVKKENSVSQFAVEDIYEFPHLFKLENQGSKDAYEEWFNENHNVQPAMAPSSDVEYISEDIILTKDDLMTIPSIGPVKAQKMLDDGIDTFAFLEETYSNYVDAGDEEIVESVYALQKGK